MNRSLLGLFIIFLNITFTMCACGHTEWLSLPGNLLGTARIWTGFVQERRRTAAILLVICMTMILSGLALMKNATDILWTGHEALFQSSDRHFTLPARPHSGRYD